MKFKYNKAVKERLDKFLNEQLPDISRSQIKKLILQEKITVNGEKSSVHHWLKNGDTISYDKKSEAHDAGFDFKLEPKIIEETSDYLVIEKPSGLLVHPTEKHETNTLADWLKIKFPNIKSVGDDTMRPGIVHRLDKEVSGLMVVALTQDYFDLLKQQFQKRKITKEYIGLVHGQMLNDKGEITTPLERDKKTGLMKAQTTKESGQTAQTTYEAIKKFINYTLLKIKIKTGRTHQIRAHLYSIGHSLVGDQLYQTKDLRKKKKTLEQRIFLHAYYLKFKDATGLWHKYKSPLPPELEEFLNTIK